MSFKRADRAVAGRGVWVALLGLSLLLLAASVSAQTSPAPSQPASSQPASASGADTLHAQVIKLAREGKYAEALPLARRVLGLREKELGREHALVAVALQNVAAINQQLGKADEAETFYKRALAVYEKAGGEEYTPQIAKILHSLALLEVNVGKAVSLHERALKLKEKAEGPRSLSVASTLFPLGHLYEMSGDYGRAEESFKRFVEIAGETGTGAADDTAVAHTRLSCLLRKRGRDDDALRHESRAEAIFRSVADGRGKIVEGGVINGKAIYKPGPRYPVEARNARAQGVITVKILVGEGGRVLASCAEGSGHPALKQAAEWASYGARFTPTLVEGVPIKVGGVITYNFVLR